MKITFFIRLLTDKKTNKKKNAIHDLPKNTIEKSTEKDKKMLDSLLVNLLFLRLVNKPSRVSSIAIGLAPKHGLFTP
ncbi:hypothetical protein [Vibrio cincinnatiensis]|uniref:hypothetical protein n=1 Tax=Vibrio cincinnatiensis TaxID=675 RepID=UPI0012ACB171|nr:hypothetical protein [Vibrio cincinnatiensis]MCG3721440.1 hypothetical protein [Vibrio cincinnatiensis]MCG3733652.1 hypothetical protein [Vibrio cincinnatiensis]MCG3741206.1 hypothetical protein [Vibrio cincinnatiensis]MCG3742804.1 hypothetical protein [Vibrio cincinnatiensis]